MSTLLIAINNVKRIHFNVSIGLGLIYEHLIENGYSASCVNYFIDQSFESVFVEKSGDIPELVDLPAILLMLRNARHQETNLLRGIRCLHKKQKNNLYYLESKIKSLDLADIDIVGFSIYSLSFMYSIYCALLLRRKKPNIRVVFGGYHVSLSLIVRNFLLNAGIADIAVIGDGSEPMLRIVKGEVQKGIVHGAFKCKVLSPVRYYMQTSSPVKSYMMMTSVGCPFQCRFCASDREYVEHDLAVFSKEATLLMEKVKVEQLHLVDDEINASVERALLVCETMRTFGIPWSCFLTPTNITKELALRLKESGCNRVFLGADSFSDKRLRFINKPTTEQKNIEAITMLADQGLRITVSLILGFPNESRQERSHNIQVYKKIKKRYGKQVYACISVFKVYPGAYFYTHPEKSGIRLTYWPKKYHRIVPELEHIIRSAPKGYRPVHTNIKSAIRLMKRFNNYIPEHKLDKKNCTFEVHASELC